MIKSFETWFLREHGDGNFSRLESGEYVGEYADLAVRNYWGIWKGVWEALGEQQSDVARLVTLLEHARCNTCDGSGALYDGYGQICQCQWCHERAEALVKYRNQGGEV